MNKFELATKVIGLLTAAVALAGLFNMALMKTFMPFIVAGTAVTFVLYVITCFNKRQTGKVLGIIVLVLFAAAIVIYNNFI